jgi:hypothetical protein
VFLIVGSVLNAVAVIEFVRRRKLDESFALLWVVLSIFGVIAALSRSLLDRLASALGVAYGATLFLAVGLVILLFVGMVLSLYVSRLQSQVEILAQEVAFLRGAAEPGTPEEHPGFVSRDERQ